MIVAVETAEMASLLRGLGALGERSVVVSPRFRTGVVLL